MPFSQKLLMVPACALAWMAGAVLTLAMLGVGPARADALLLVDVDSGQVISEQNSTYPWYPASVTKLMTTYVTLKAVRDHRVTLDSVFTVSPKAVAQQPSKMGFKAGTQVTVDNALKMLLVHSANDMAVVLAEGVSGSIEKFADEMNAAARSLGMTQTNYVNPNGLPDDEQVTSARDLAILARALIREFPEYDYYWHIASIRLGKRIYRNTNKLIDAYPGTDGMKTGFICASGFNLVATATRGDKRLVAVVLGATSSNARAVKAAQLFERGFSADPLAWLMPSLGTVDSLVPTAVAPPNLRDEICVNNRRRHPTEDAEEGGEAGAGTTAGVDDVGALSLPSLRGVMPHGTALLTSGLAAAIPPIDVYTGPPRNASAAHAPTAATPVPKKKPEATAVAAKPPATKPAPTQSPVAKPVPAVTSAVKPAPTTAPASAKPPVTANGTKPPSGDKAAATAAAPKAKSTVTASPKPPSQIAPKAEPKKPEPKTETQ